MTANTKIEWCDHTFNPWLGCTQVSAACDHCYAKDIAERFRIVEWNGPPKRTSDANWRGPRAWDRRARAAGRRESVFCASMADVFDNQVPDEWRADLWRLIDDCRSLNWLLLTKRPQNARKMLPAGWPWQHVWLGATVENQAEADRRLPILRALPAAGRFISAEPLLGNPGAFNLTGIGWVICGGESGRGCRPFDQDWARTLRDRCRRYGIPFFMKQLGGWPGKRDDIGRFPADLRIREFPRL